MFQWYVHKHYSLQSTIWCSASGLSTHASTPIKWLIRNGWPGCCCTLERIPLTLKHVFTAHAAVNEIKWIHEIKWHYPQKSCSLMQNNPGDIAKFNCPWNKHCIKSAILPARLRTCQVVHRFGVHTSVITFFFKGPFFKPDLLWFPVEYLEKPPKI